ncbi:MAG: DUF1257 domain-containing protein [Planctomycetales bacterium]|nr:DUF1257 domain-containing protein [Planctomycetales bacterium]
MSHIVTIATEVRDPAALGDACARLGLAAPVHETTRLFGGEATGWCVHLPGWKYPVVCDTDNGQVRLDDYEGQWGDRQELDSLLQAYACEKAKREARRHGHSVTEQLLPDGSIRLTIFVGEGT